MPKEPKFITSWPLILWGLAWAASLLFVDALRGHDAISIIISLAAQPVLLLGLAYFLANIIKEPKANLQLISTLKILFFSSILNKSIDLLGLVFTALVPGFGAIVILFLNIGQLILITEFLAGLHKVSWMKSCLGQIAAIILIVIIFVLLTLIGAGGLLALVGFAYTP